MARRSCLSSVHWSGECNPSLWLNKFPASLDRNSPLSFNRIFEDMAKFGPSSIYKLAYQRRKKALESSALVAEGVATERLAVGLGCESTLETSIALEPTYGVPIIPGSALKGVAAFFARQELEGWEISSEAYRQLFGASDKDGTQQAGCVVFHDAWPDPAKLSKLFQQDVINVHHPEYYQSEAERVSDAPADWDSPVPIGFLTTSGTFLVAVSGESAEWNRRALQILQMALEEYGVGSKTGRGYGRLSLKLPKAETTVQGASASDWQQALGKVTARDKGQFNQLHVAKWEKAFGQERLDFGKAIAAKVKELGWEKDWMDKAWLKKIKSELGEG